MPDQPGKFNLAADIAAATAAKAQAANKSTAPSDESGQVSKWDIIRLLGATAARVVPPMAGQAAGALLPFPGAAETLGAIGGGAGEALAEQLEPGHPLTHLVRPNAGRVAVSTGLGAVPLSWMRSIGRPLAGVAKGGALSYAGIAGNKIADKGLSADAVNPLQWSGDDKASLLVGSALGGATSYIGAPRNESSSPVPPTPINPAVSELKTPSGLRVAANKLAQRPTGSSVTPGVLAAHEAVANAIDANPTGPLAQEVIGPKGVPKKPSINEMDILHQTGLDEQANMTSEQKRAYQESKTEQDMLTKAQKYAEKVKADKQKAQLSSGTEQSRAIDKQIKAGEKADKTQIQEGTAEARGIDAANKRTILDQKAEDLAAQQTELDNRKTADGVVPVKGPVVETLKGVGDNGEPQSSRTTYKVQDEEPGGGVDDEGNPIKPLLPHEQAYFSKGDALKAAKAANKAAAEKGQPLPYDPTTWNIIEHPEGGARIVQKAGRVAASQALTDKLASEGDGVPKPVNQVPQSPESLYKTVDPETLAKNGVPTSTTGPDNLPVDPSKAPANAAAIAELEQETKTNPLLGGGPVPEAPPPPPPPPPAPVPDPVPGPISLDQFNKVNSAPTQAPLPLEPTEASPAPPQEPQAVPEPPPAPPATPTVAKGIGSEGQPIIPFRTPLEAAGSNYESVLAAKRAGEAVPEAGRVAAGAAAGRIKSESPISPSEWDAMTDRQKQNFLTNIKRGLNSGSSPKAPVMDAIRPDITGPNGEMGPEIPAEPTDVPPPPTDKGTTLSAFGAGQGSNVMTAIRNNPMLAARLGLGATGAAIGAANDKNDPLNGAITGGLVGAALPSAGKAIGNINWGTVAKKVPDLERFAYLIPPNSMLANTIGAPVGLAGTTGVEKYLEGMFNGSPEERQQAVNLIKGIPSLARRWWPAMGEAGRMLTESPENVGEMAMTSGKPTTAKGWANAIIAAPAQSTTAAHLAGRDIAMEAGYPKDLATEMFLGNDPSTGAGNKTIRIFGKGLQNAKATTIDQAPGMKNILMSMAAPFTRTASNVAAATPTRTPILGALLKAAGQTDESWAAIAAQQGVGTAISGAAYLAGENTDPETAKTLRKWVRNMGGRYGMVATIAFEMGQAARQNKSLSQAAGKGVVSGVPMPTTEPFQDLWNSGIAGSNGNLQLPGSFIPSTVKPYIPPEFMTRKSR